MTIRHLKLTGAGADRGIAIQSNADNNTIQDMEITAWNIGVITGDAQGNVVETRGGCTCGEGKPAGG